MGGRRGLRLVGPGRQTGSAPDEGRRSRRWSWVRSGGRPPYWAWAVLAAGALLAVAQFPTGFLAISPGLADDAGGLVTVEGGSRDSAGRFLVTTVSAQEVNALGAAYAALHPQVSLRLKSQVLPPGMGWDEYLDRTRVMMADSQAVASVVALCALGREARLDGEGAEVAEVLPSSPAEGKLKPGDVVRAVDGQEVTLAEDLLALVRARSPGERVRLAVERGSERLDLEVELARSSAEPGKGSLMLAIKTRGLKAVSPVKVDFSTGDISGPSAGLVLALEIMDQLDPRDLTGGRVVAGTGTLDDRGRVGPVGGAREKALAARAAGASVFLVPAGDEATARSIPGLEVVPVATLEDALAYLGRRP